MRLGPGEVYEQGLGNHHLDLDLQEADVCDGRDPLVDHLIR
jgi:hypothetical protein